MEKVRYTISDAAQMMDVESHALRYWEEELDLSVPRNEQGHRYYTKENIEQFQKIKDLKEKGYQLSHLDALTRRTAAFRDRTSTEGKSEGKGKTTGSGGNSTASDGAGHAYHKTACTEQ